jgi:hypothetical protein
LFIIPTVLLLLVSQLIQTTIVTNPVMATDQFTTTPAFPTLILAVKELRNSILFDKIQILDHTHSITRSVSAVNGFQPITWKVAALKTEMDLVICQFWTIFSQVGTSLISWPAACAIRHSDAFVFHVILV